MKNIAVSHLVKKHLSEDGLLEQGSYFHSLPKENVQLQLFIKNSLLLSGSPFFQAVFEELGAEAPKLSNFEGYEFKEPKIIELGVMPFSVALTAERLALNYLQHASAISTYTKRFVDLVGPEYKILDTRKTTPGLRLLEKYATKIGGACNHRQSQTDIWMIKDNHKTFFGGLENAISFFKNQKQFYKPVVCEIHSLEELQRASELSVHHFMLDNFQPQDIKEAVMIKKENWTYEVSGGLRLENIKDYCIKGVDAFSVGAITYDAPAVDISLKYH